MSGQPLLEVQNISKAFGGIQALSGVSFHVNARDIFGIIGPNGSGKTTLVNSITGFVRIDSGKVNSIMRPTMPTLPYWYTRLPW